MATENIPSRLHCVAEGNVLAGANEILDDDKGKKQTVINQENDQRLETLETAVGTGGSVDSRIESAKTEIVGGASSDCNTLGKAEALISTNANDIAALQEAYAALTQNDVVVVAPSDTWPVATPAQNIIYRVVDRTNTPPQYYTDYMWNGTAMVEMAQYNNAIDAVPTAGSHNLVESGGVQNELALGAVYDVSAHNSNATFDSLEALLSNANLDTLIPTTVRKGGMSIKFVQSSDNKYVQYRLMADDWSTTESDWQKQGAEVSVSQNTLMIGGESKGLIGSIIIPAPQNVGYFINSSNGELTSSSTYSYSDYIPVKPGDVIEVSCFPGSNQVATITTYDDAKSRIECLLSGNGEPYKYVDVTIPNGVSYIRLSMANNTHLRYIPIVISNTINYEAHSSGEPSVKSAVLNVNTLNNNSNVYADKNTARGAVSAKYRKSGIKLIYLLANVGWVTEQFIGDVSTDWLNDGYWFFQEINEKPWYLHGEELHFETKGKVLGIDGAIETASTFDIAVCNVTEGDVLLIDGYSASSDVRPSVIGYDEQHNLQILVAGFNASTQQAMVVIPQGIVQVSVSLANDTHAKYIRRYARLIRNTVIENPYGTEIDFPNTGVLTSNGDTTPLEGSKLSDYIRVNEGDKVCYTGYFGSGNPCVYCYNEAKYPIGAALLSPGVGQGYFNKVTSLLSRTSFIRVCGTDTGSIAIKTKAYIIKGNSNVLHDMQLDGNKTKAHAFGDVDIDVPVDQRLDANTVIGTNEAVEMVSYRGASVSVEDDYVSIMSAANQAYSGLRARYLASLIDKSLQTEIEFEARAFGTEYMPIWYNSTPSGIQATIDTSGNYWTKIKAILPANSVDFIQWSSDGITGTNYHWDIKNLSMRQVDSAKVSLQKQIDSTKYAETLTDILLTVGSSGKYWTSVALAAGTYRLISPIPAQIALATALQGSTIYKAWFGYDEITITEASFVRVYFIGNPEVTFRFVKVDRVELPTAVKTLQDKIEWLPTLAGKKLSVIGDSISTIYDRNASYYKVLSVDVGNEIQSYVTWWDVWTDYEGVVPTNKSIGGVTLTSAMIGTLQAFTPVAGDVGKLIGESRNYNAIDVKVWTQWLCELTGMTLLSNAAWSGSRICSGQTGPYLISEAWSDYTIHNCGARDADGNNVSPDVIIIYRGTNDFSHDPIAQIDNVPLSDGIPATDYLDSKYEFEVGYYLTIQKLREAYPEAYIICCTLNVFKRLTYDKFPTRNGYYTLPQMNDSIRKIANTMGCGLIEFDKDGITFENCYTGGYITDSDTIPTHPNSKGHQVMAERALADLKYILQR